ncbi:L-asparaginase 1-like isoform X2 [Gordionus sp. m RMFG-2023]|uniref:L-asparaginase 1-like isoform X2 n=1 Tax=Gordionus sp. m RMFG-2023 TaxID=3053472 RepID=UPI0031FE27B0
MCISSKICNRRRIKDISSIYWRYHWNGFCWWSPVPDILYRKLRKSTSLNDLDYSRTKTIYENEDFLALPKMADSKRIIYKIVEYDTLLDSSNMCMDDWIRIATDIYKYYKFYDGFVVLHGTDTMSYTASALSFILENLGKPVILTGSQIPLVEVRSDGRDNFIGALVLATYNIPEVCIYFDHRLYRGNRTRKIDNSSFTAFNSPNMPPLANMGVDIKIDWDNVFPASSHKMRVQTELCRDVGMLQLFPGISSQTVKAFLQTPLRGLVLESYGTGNAPSNRPDLIKSFHEATNDKGIIIVNCTQCPVGSVSCSYATGKVLMEAGVIAGFDMTPEAALTKLSYVLAKDEWDIETKKKMMSSNLRGELTIKCQDKLILRDFEFLNAIANSLNLSTSPEIKDLQISLFPLLLCLAALSNDVKTMEMLLEKGGNVNMADYDKRTPLHVASSQGNLTIVNYLLEKGASVFVKDSFNSTPLYNAIYFKHFHIIEAMTRVGAHLVMPPTEIGDHLCQLRNMVVFNPWPSWKAYRKPQLRIQMGLTAIRSITKYKDTSFATVLFIKFVYR